MGEPVRRRALGLLLVSMFLSDYAKIPSKIRGPTKPAQCGCHPGRDTVICVTIMDEVERRARSVGRPLSP